MDDDQLFAAILETSFVKTDLHRRVRLLREYLEQRFFGSDRHLTLPEFLSQQKADEEDIGIVTGWGDAFYGSFTEENTYALLEKITEKSKALETMNVYVPFEPDAKETVRLGGWVRQNVDKNILIDIQVDSATFGGCAFAWNGKYHDYSLRHLMSANMSEIQKTLGEFAKK